jgi:hypothetical protein
MCAPKETLKATPTLTTLTFSATLHLHHPAPTRSQSGHSEVPDTPI